MSEGYLITDCSMKNLTQVELLIKSIKCFDPTKPISIIAHEKNLKKYLLYVDNEIFIEKNKRSIPTAVYFHSLLQSPYEKTITFQPDQLLTDFDPSVWENLRGMNSIVLPKTRFSFNGQTIDSSIYHKGDLEEKSFETSSILNSLYFNKTKGCDYVFGMCVLIASKYNQHTFIDFLAANELTSMPTLPEYLWPEWLMTLMYKILPAKMTKFDYLHCVDLSIRENSYVNNNWSKRPWTEFLSYWVNETGSIKIENFVQNGLIKYNTSAWLTEETLANLRKKYI